MDLLESMANMAEVCIHKLDTRIDDTLPFDKLQSSTSLDEACDTEVTIESLSIARSAGPNIDLDMNWSTEAED